MRALGLIDYFLLFALALTTVLIVRFGFTQVNAALRTGRLPRRGAVLERDAQPIMFWRGILFWIVVSLGMIVVNVIAALAIFRPAG